MTEKEFLCQVRDLAKLFGWSAYHPFLSKWSERGWPDITLAKEMADGSVRIIFAELKTDKGKLTPPQAEWISRLQRVGGNISAYVWRPADFDEIVGILRLDGKKS